MDKNTMPKLVPFINNWCGFALVVGVAIVSVWMVQSYKSFSFFSDNLSIAALISSDDL
jgi:hypothetical protein